MLNGTSVSIPDGADSAFVVSFDLRVGGRASVEAHASSKNLASNVDIDASILGFLGKVFFSFSNTGTPAVLVSSSGMPDLAFDIFYGTQPMGRLSSLSLLVLKSLINSHLVYPNSLPILVRKELIEGQRLIEVPTSLFNSAFLKLQTPALAVPEQLLEDHPFVSCHVMFAGQKIRTDSVPAMPDTRWHLAQKFALTEQVRASETLPLSIKIYSKRKKSAQSVLLEELLFDVEMARVCSLLRLKRALTKVPAVVFSVEIVLVTPELCKTLIPWKEDTLSAQASKKYLNGMGWSNLKMALQNLVSGPTKADFLAVEEGIVPTGAAPEEEVHDPSLEMLNRLRHYEHQIVNILHFLSDHSENIEQDALLLQIQTSLEAFRSDLIRMIESYPDSMQNAEEIGQIIQSFIDLVTQKIAKIDDNDQSREMLHPIEQHLKSFIPATDFPARPLSDAGGETAAPAADQLYVHENFAASAPALDSQLALKDGMLTVPRSDSEFLCHLGACPVSLVLADQSILIEDLHSSPSEVPAQSFSVFSLAESYGLDLSLEAIMGHQFTKKWSLTVDPARLTLTQSSYPHYFPYLCISTLRLLKIKAFDGSRGKSSSKAPFLELYYLQDEEQNMVEYQKIFASASDIARIYEELQSVFLLRTGLCELQWASIDRVDLSGPVLSLFLNPQFDPHGALEAVRIGRFFGPRDMHEAYCDLQARVHRRGRCLSPLSGSLSPLGGSATSLAGSVDEARRPISTYQLYRPLSPIPEDRDIHQYALNSFGLAIPSDLVTEYSCSYNRRGINIGRLLLSPEHLCFSGKRNGVRTSKVLGC